MTEQSAILQDSVAGAKGSGGASNFDRYIFAMLIALEFLMSFTFLGYIHLPPISITTAYIPILVAACILGVSQAAVVGTVFGLCSMYKASATYVMASDMVFSPFLSGAPVKSLLLSVGTRTLFGLLIGLLFSWAKKTKHRKIGFAVIAAGASRLQAAMVLGAMGTADFPRWDSIQSIRQRLSRDGVFRLRCSVSQSLEWRMRCIPAKRFSSFGSVWISRWSAQAYRAT